MKSKNRSARGRKTVEEPNPAIVPITSAIKAKRKNKTFTILSYQKLGWLGVDYPAECVTFNDYPLFSRIGRLETEVKF